MASLYLIRHGQARFGTDDYDRLSTLGERQASVLGEYLRTCGIVFDAAYCGELLRQRRTAEIVTAAMPSVSEVQVDARLNEIDNDGQFAAITPILLRREPALASMLARAAQSSKDYQKVLERVFEYWVRAGAIDGILSWADFSGAVRDVLHDIMRREGSGRSTAVFSSGGTIATAVAMVIGCSAELTYQFYEPMVNCSVTRLLYNRDKVSLAFFNDYSFLDLLGRQRGESLVTFR